MVKLILISKFHFIRHIRLNGENVGCCSGQRWTSTSTEFQRNDKKNSATKKEENVDLYPKETPSIFSPDMKMDNRFEYLRKWLPHERKFLAKLVENLPTVEEKIRFVNPYERAWARWEYKRHRPWQRPLHDPRKAYRLTPVPNGYNSLNLYKFATQTHCINRLPPIYDQVQVDQEDVDAFRDKVFELLKQEFGAGKDWDQTIESFLDQLSSSIVLLFSDKFNHIKTAQIATNIRYESFWIRSGFMNLYDRKEFQYEIEKRHRDAAKSKEGVVVDEEHRKAEIREEERLARKVVGDDFYRIGELAFCFQDAAAVQFRSTLPLPQFVNWDEDVCRTCVPECLYDPTSFNVHIEENPLFMRPGYEYGDRHEFGLFMLNSFKNLRQNIKNWQAVDEVDEFNDCLLSAAISCCHSWLVGQAHYLGFTQYNDLTYPLTTQVVFTDGAVWYLAAYQLNTLNLLHDFDDEGKKKTKKCNVCWFEGPFTLFELDSDGKFNVKDENVLKTLLKFVFLSPALRSNVENMRPFINPISVSSSQVEVNEEADKQKLEIADVMYTLK